MSGDRFFTVSRQYRTRISRMYRTTHMAFPILSLLPERWLVRKTRVPDQLLRGNLPPSRYRGLDSTLDFGDQVYLVKKG